MNTARLIRIEPDQQWDQAIVDSTLARCPGWSFAEDADSDVGVVIVPGRYDGAEARTQEAVDSLAGAVVVVTGDEEAQFAHDQVWHPRARWWHQLPRAEHERMRLFGDGAPAHFMAHLRDLGPHVERRYDWSLSFQANHKRRLELVAVLEGMDGGFLNVSPGFTQGLAHREYAELMASTKVVPCPGGKWTADTFRAFEALEAGCIPVVDGVTYSTGDLSYWTRLFGETPPFPVISGGWDTFPGVLAEWLEDWQEKANHVQAWWLARKRQMACDLADDLAAVSA